MGKELLESRRTHHAFAFLTEDGTQVFVLEVVHALIVDDRQRIELPSTLLECLFGLFVLEAGQLSQVGILRMEGKDADAAVGIGVGPCVCQGGVVDGKHLQHALSGAGRPLDHAFEVTEVAHTAASFRAEGEHRNEGTAAADGCDGEVGLVEFVDHHVAIVHLGQRHKAVVAQFPLQSVVAFEGIFEFKGVAFDFLSVDVKHPFMVCMFEGARSLVGVPVAERLAAAGNDEFVAVAQARCPYLEAHCLCKRRGAVARRMVVNGDAVGHRRTIQVGIAGYVHPMIEDAIAGGLLGVEVKPMFLHGPSAFHNVVATHHGVEIIQFRARCLIPLQHAFPPAAVVGVHPEPGRFGHGIGRWINHVQHQFFAINGLMVDIKMQVHSLNR